MNPLIELNLPLILFLPRFLILGTLFWVYPRQPRHAARMMFDISALALSATGFVTSVQWSLANASSGYGKLWPQILATAVGYGVWLAAMTLALFVRRWWLLKAKA
jgi:hypothetical protein